MSGSTRADPALAPELPVTVATEGPGIAESRHREVSAGGRFPALDGYRAIAAMMVLLTHVAFNTGFVVTGTWGHVLSRFDFGVPLFFLMSGFLLYRPWARAALEGRPHPHHRRYAVRRAARILPAYWVVVVVTLLVLPEIKPVPIDQWWRHLLAIQIYQPSGAIEGLTQTWSLCTEIAFYVVLPFLGAAALGRRRRSPESAWRRQMVMLVVLVVVANAFTAVRVTTDQLPPISGTWLPAYLDWFAAGMCLALIEVRSRQAAPPALVRAALTAAADQYACLAIAAGLFAVSTTPLGGPYDLAQSGPWETFAKHWLYLGAATFLLLPGVLRGEGRPVSWLARPLPHRLGLISYGIFLWHLVLLRVLMPVLGISLFGGRPLLLAVVLIPVSIAVATVTYRLIERPAQVWAHRF